MRKVPNCEKHKLKKSVKCSACEDLMIENIRKEFGMKPLSKEKDYKSYLEDARKRTNKHGDVDYAYKKGYKPNRYEQPYISLEDLNSEKI